MGTVGFTRQVWVSSLPSGCTLWTQISTMRSLVTLIPVVSRSKKQMGRLSFKSMVVVLMLMKKPPNWAAFKVNSKLGNVPKIRGLNPKLLDTRPRVLRTCHLKRRQPRGDRSYGSRTFYDGYQSYRLPVFRSPQAFSQSHPRP